MRFSSVFTALAAVQTAFAAPQGLQERGTEYALETRQSAPPTISGKVNALYYPNWAIYGDRPVYVDAIPAADVTHILYAFGDITSNGTVVSSDNQSDTGTPEGQPEPVNVGGNIRDLFALKKNNRHIKILLSIGGYTSSQEGQFKGAVKDDASRKRFATSAVRIMKDWGFDGLDIDWEYPTNASEAEQLRLLLRECRIALDSYADRNDQSYRMLLTIATSAAKSTYGVLNLPAIDKFVDLWFLMAYDYTGSWSTSSGHHAALYKDSSNMKATPVNTDDTVKDYISKGVPSRKIVLGIPTYGRGFGSTVKGFGKDFKGNGGQDAFLYKDLPFKGTNTESGTNTKVVAAWTWDPAKKIMVSYDNPSTVATKAKYARDKNLGGAMFWDAAGDKAGDQSLVRAAKNNLGTLDRSNNLLEFKNSRYQNIRDKTAR